MASTRLTAACYRILHGRASRAQVFWASDPVQPGETVLLQGCDFAEATVEVARVDDSTPHGTGHAPDIQTWTATPVLQASDCSLKFVLPADWKPGVFACRVKDHQATSATVLLNAPDPWWIQGDEGPRATPGGWLRVLGKSLRFSRPSVARLEPETGPPTMLEPAAADGYSMRLNLPATLRTGRYRLLVHNGFGGDAAWRPAGTIEVVPPTAWPTKVSASWKFTARTPKPRCARRSSSTSRSPIEAQVSGPPCRRRRPMAAASSTSRRADTGSRARSTCRRGPCSKARPRAGRVVVGRRPVQPRRRGGRQDARPAVPREVEGVVGAYQPECERGPGLGASLSRPYVFRTGQVL